MLYFRFEFCLSLSSQICWLLSVSLPRWMGYLWSVSLLPVSSRNVKLQLILWSCVKQKAILFSVSESLDLFLLCKLVFCLAWNPFISGFDYSDRSGTLSWVDATLSCWWVSSLSTLVSSTTTSSPNQPISLVQHGEQVTMKSKIGFFFHCKAVFSQALATHVIEGDS